VADIAITGETGIRQPWRDFIPPRRIRTRLYVNHGRGVAFYGLDPYPAIGSRLALRALGATAGILQSATERPQGRDRGGVGLDP
jgi:hypothetical protein